jgi:diguanylate cyclase (GGDEF)-like protein
MAIYVHFFYGTAVFFSLFFLILTFNVTSAAYPQKTLNYLKLLFLNAAVGFSVLWLIEVNVIVGDLRANGLLYVVAWFSFYKAIDAINTHSKRTNIVGSIMLIFSIITLMSNNRADLFNLLSVMVILICPFVLHAIVKATESSEHLKRDFGLLTLMLVAIIDLLIAIVQIVLYSIDYQYLLALKLPVLSATSTFVLIGFGFVISVLYQDKLQISMLAARDPLTGALNRRGFKDKLEALGSSEEQHSSIIVMDLDRFKSVNDQYGHDGGDEVLRVFSKRISSNIRDGDLFVRLGGEEFALLLRNNSKKSALLIAEKLRKLVADDSIEFGQYSLNVTCSFGIASFDNTSSIDDAIRLADEALYKAKQAGRNCVFAA